MSHFVVAVFHREDQDVNKLLAKYDENLMVEPYVRFTKEQAIQHCKENWSDEYLKGKSDEKLWSELAKRYDNITDEDGNIYTTYNPDSKWDWYQIGGRWDGFLKLKRRMKKNYGSAYVNEAYVRDVDFGMDKDEYKASLRFWDVVVEKKEPEEGEEYFSIYNDKYFRDFYGDRETYARRASEWSTRAVVTPDGEWHERGEMGYFGCSYESPEEAADWDERFHERFIESADPDWLITIVDCHI